MGLADEIDYVGGLLDAYAAGRRLTHVAAEHPGEPGAPPNMQVGPVDDEGWVEWRVIPSTLSVRDVEAVEEEFGARFPTRFRAYLLARHHVFDQVRSRRHDQVILMTDVPSGRKLQKLRRLLAAWRPLLSAGFIPFAEWGDGWGPMCFDAAGRGEGADCPVVWLDHEHLVGLGSKANDREAVRPLAQPIYHSFQELLLDVFTS